ncbi:MAG TPA: response regulator, partial [Gemmatimonadaceae bacterium]|nr:response regulator [Gemmatimonadaceae bacterium]
AEARSAGPGRGSEFVVELPLGPAPSAAVAPGEAPNVTARARATGRRVLVVDDNRDAAELLAEGLRLHGHEVRVAFDGPSALEVADELEPEVALLDIGLPVMNGYELARRLRERGARCHLVAVTGYGQEADRIRAREHGFDTHVVKPVDLEKMRELVRRAGCGG